MALREQGPNSASESRELETPRMEIGVATVLKLAEDKRDSVAKDIEDGITFGPGEVDVNGDLLRIYQGWLNDHGVVMLPHEHTIAPDILAGGDAEELIDYDQEPELLRRAA